METEKSIITVTVAPSWIYPNAANNRRTPGDLVESVVDAWKAGATIAHVHGDRNFSESEWKTVFKGIRDRTDIILQIGLSSLPIPERMPVIEMKPDMLSIILNHHSEAFPHGNVDIIHDVNELIEYAKLCNKFGIKPEWEVWHAGSVWNLNYLVDHGHLSPPHFVTLFFDWPGGTWSPATPEELLHRLKQQRHDSICSVSVMSHAQTKMVTMSLLLGHSARVGTEDNPYLFPDKLSKDNAELVSRIMSVAKQVGRNIATPDDGRQILGLEKGRK